MNQPMGKNALCKIPKEIAKYLNLPNADMYVFHSFRRTAATFASEAGMSENELCDFFSWLNSSMAREYTSSTKRSARVMGGVLLGGNNRFNADAAANGPGLSGPGSSPAAPGLSGAGAAPGGLTGPSPAAPGLSGAGAAPGGLTGPSPAVPGLSGAGAAPGGPTGSSPAAPGLWGPGAAYSGPYGAFPGWGIPPYPAYIYSAPFYNGYGMPHAAPWAPYGAPWAPPSWAPTPSHPPPAKVQRLEEDKDIMNNSLDEFAAELDRLEEQQEQKEGQIIVKKEGKKQAMSTIASSGLKELINKETKIEKLVFNVYHSVDTVNN